MYYVLFTIFIISSLKEFNFFNLLLPWFIEQEKIFQSSLLKFCLFHKDNLWNLYTVCVCCMHMPINVQVKPVNKTNTDVYY